MEEKKEGNEVNFENHHEADHLNSELKEKVISEENLDDSEDLEQTEEAAALAELDEEELDKIDQSSLEQLQDLINSILKEDKIKEFRKGFNRLRKRFQEIYDEEKEKIHQKFLDEGGKSEDFQFYPPAIMDEIRASINKFRDRLADIRKREEQELQENFLAKQDVIHELKLLISEESDIKKAFEKFNQLKEKWSSIGTVPSQYAQELWNNYNFFKDKFYEFVQINRELYELELAKNLEIKNKLIERVEALKNEPSIKRSIELLHDIQKEWRETGPIAREITNEVFEKFKAAYDAVYKRRDDFLREREETRQKNLSLKNQLCEQVEQMASMDFKTLQEWKKQEVEVKKIDETWKTIGRVPKQFNDSVWDRFKSAKRDFFRKKIPLLKQIKDELSANYDAKIKLCERAEALKDSTDWKNTTMQFIRLQTEWKKIGPVERRKSEEIWLRFRGACDAFFKAKDDYIAGQGDREIENLNLKKDIISRLKAFTPVESLDENLNFIKQLQDEWGKIGYVPINEKNNLEKEFNSTVESLFASMNIDKDKKNRIEYKVKLDSMLQSHQAEKLLKDERTLVGNKIRKLEEEINQIENNLGFFGHSKGADSLKKQYEDKIQKLKDELTIYNDRKQLIKNAFKSFESK